MTAAEGKPRPGRATTAGARALSLAVPAACAGYGLARPDDLLVGGAAWLVVLAVCLAGFGHGVERITRARVDLGLRMAWGAAAYLAIAGWLLAAGWLTLPVVAALVVAGCGAYAHRQIVDEPAALAAARALTALRARSGMVAITLVIAAVAALNVVSALAELQGNVYDDDVIYTPMVRRLLDVGDIDEPFSFRRISSYGGQTVLQALPAVRGTLLNLFLLDGALFQLVLLLMIAGMARASADATRPADDLIDRGVLGLLLLTVVLMPDTSVNTGSYWTGAVLFLALYRTVALPADAIRPTAAFACAGVVAAGVCTLRQSYLPVAALFLLVALVVRLRQVPGRTWRDERGPWLAAIGGGLVALLPYCIAAWRSNQTFLYPFMTGTFNPNVQMQPTVFSIWQELAFFAKVLIEPDPFRVMLTLVPVLCLVVDRRPGRPFTVFTVASFAGFALLVHSFLLSNARNLWRYAFGYSTVLYLILVIEAARLGLRRGGDDRAPLSMPLTARLIIVASLLIQVAVSGRGLAKKYADVASDLDAITSAAPATADALAARRYAQLQAAVPAGAPLAIMLDEPYHLDYARNDVVNLDTPGFASYRPGMPFFRGPQPVIDYFLGHGIRHIAFVRGDRSRYMYRREYWLNRLLWDTELWRVQGAYAVDAIDNLEAIAGQRAVLFEADGMVVVDLAVPR